MKLAIAYTAILIAPVTGFLPVAHNTKPAVALKGYLEDLGAIPPPEDVEEDDSREATALEKEKVSNMGVGDWSSYVEFNEFDGGDGQMGVAGDGNSKLEKFDMSSMAKSKMMSAKNAWGTSTGYADELVSKGMEQQKAQQLENWKNQQEVLAARKQQKYMTDEFDRATEEVNQWDLSKFGVERNQDFDLDEAFGAVTAGNIDGVIELHARMNQFAVHEFNVKNEYMGFADFRAAFTADTPPFWTIEPTEGSLDKKGTDFILRFRPSTPSVVEGYLVIETEDFKKTFHLIGGVA